MDNGNPFEAWVGQVLESGDNNFQHNKMARKVPTSKEEYTHSDPKLKAKMDWIKATKNAQRAIMQDSQWLLKFMAKQCSTMANDPMSGVSTQLMTNIKECYAKVLAQSQTITELLLEGQYVDLQHFDVNKFSPRLDSIKAVLNTTKCTKGIGNMNIC